MMIELDVSAPWEAPEPPISRARPPRRLIAGLLLMGVLVLIGGARATTTYEALYSVDGDASVTMLSGGRLFIVRDGDNADSHLTAYRVTDGAVLWTSPINISGRDLLYADDHLLLTIESESGQNEPTIAARDAATGRVLWQRTDVAADQVVDGVLVAETPEAPDHHRLTYGIAVETGVVKWTIDSPDGTALSFLYRGADYVNGLYGIAQLTADRVVRVRDPRTGEVVDTVQLQRDVPAGLSAPIDSFDIIDGALVAFLSGGATVAFDAVTGAYRWRLPGSSEDGFLIPCGAVICHGHSQTMTGVDPVSGRALWTFDQWNWVSPLDDKHIVVNRLSGDLQPLSGGAVFDVTGGTVTRALGSWRVISSTGNLLLVWRPDPTSHDGDALVGILDPTSAAVSVIAHASGWYSQPHCRLSGRYLACNDRLDIAVWRMP